MGENGGGSFIVGFVIGAMAGAAAALLLAPQSGVETRRVIGEKSNELAGEANRIAGDAKTQAQKLATDAKGQVEVVGEKGRVVISENVRKAQDAVTGKPAGAPPPATEAL